MAVVASSSRPPVSEKGCQDLHELVLAAKKKVNNYDEEYHSSHDLDLLDKLEWAVARFIVAEELVLYPLLRRALDKSRATKIVRSSSSNHTSLRESVLKIHEEEPGSFEFFMGLAQMSTQVTSHLDGTPHLKLVDEIQGLDKDSENYKSAVELYRLTERFIPSSVETVGSETPTFPTIGSLLRATSVELKAAFKKMKPAAAAPAEGTRHHRIRKVPTRPAPTTADVPPLTRVSEGCGFPRAEFTLQSGNTNDTRNGVPGWAARYFRIPAESLVTALTNVHSFRCYIAIQKVFGQY